MSNIQFDEPGMEYARPDLGQGPTGLVALVIKYGLAKNEKQAQIVLVVIGLIAVAVMFFAWPSSNSTPVDTGGATNQDDLLNI